jgi:hypothetical protein
MASVGSGAFGMNSDFVDEEAEFARMTLLSEAVGADGFRLGANVRWRDIAMPPSPGSRRRSSEIRGCRVLSRCYSQPSRRSPIARSAIAARFRTARGGLGKRPWAFPPHDVSCGAVC